MVKSVKTRSPKRPSRAKAHKVKGVTGRLPVKARLFEILAVCIIYIAFAVSTFLPSLPFAQPKAAVAAPNVSLVEPPSLQSDVCVGPTQESELFTTCPSFLLDFGTQNSGQVDSNYFNAYKGPPFANREAQYYSDDTKNIRVENGRLIIQARNEPTQGYRYSSGRLNTKGLEDFKYGKLVIRAKLPSSVGTWPAIWLLPSEPKYANINPVSGTKRQLSDGEIDIAESIGSQPHVVYAVAHSLAYNEDGVDRTYFDTKTIPDNDTMFHDYSVNWTPTQIVMSIDDVPYFTYTKKPGADYHTWPYDQPFYLVINLALGGTWAGKDRTHFPLDGIDSGALPASMEIETIRYYSYVDQ